MKFLVSPPSCAQRGRRWLIRCSRAYNDCQTFNLNTYQTDLHPVFRVGRTVAVGEWSEVGFSIPQGTLPWQPILWAKSTFSPHTSLPFAARSRCTTRSATTDQLVDKKVKFPHTRYRALGPELIPVYSLAVSPQVTWSESRHRPGSRLPLLSVRPAVTSVAFTRWRYL